MDTNKVFEQTHQEGIEILGAQWLWLNDKATNIAVTIGVDYRDKKVRAMISKIILETVKEIKQ